MKLFFDLPHEVSCHFHSKLLSVFNIQNLPRFSSRLLAACIANIASKQKDGLEDDLPYNALRSFFSPIIEAFSTPFPRAAFAHVSYSSRSSYCFRVQFVSRWRLETATGTTLAVSRDEPKIAMLPVFFSVTQYQQSIRQIESLALG